MASAINRGPYASILVQGLPLRRTRRFALALAVSIVLVASTHGQTAKLVGLVASFNKACAIDFSFQYCTTTEHRKAAVRRNSQLMDWRRGSKIQQD